MRDSFVLRDRAHARTQKSSTRERSDVPPRIPWHTCTPAQPGPRRAQNQPPGSGLPAEVTARPGLCLGAASGSTSHSASTSTSYLREGQSYLWPGKRREESARFPRSASVLSLERRRGLKENPESSVKHDTNTHSINSGAPSPVQPAPGTGTRLCLKRRGGEKENMLKVAPTSTREPLCCLQTRPRASTGGDRQGRMLLAFPCHRGGDWGRGEGGHSNDFVCTRCELSSNALGSSRSPKPAAIGREGSQSRSSDTAQMEAQGTRGEVQETISQGGKPPRTWEGRRISGRSRQLSRTSPARGLGAARTSPSARPRAAPHPQPSACSQREQNPGQEKQKSPAGTISTALNKPRRTE